LGDDADANQRSFRVNGDHDAAADTVLRRLRAGNAGLSSKTLLLSFSRASTG